MVERVAYKIVLVSVCLGMCVLAQAQGQLSDSRLPGEPPPPYMLQWGSLGSGDGEFNYAHDVALDAAGNVYVVDANNGRIQKFDSSGTYVSKWGSFGNDANQFSTPHGLGLDASGNIYVADTNNHRIQKFDDSGTFVSAWGWGVDTGAGEYEVCTAASVPCRAGTTGTGNGQFKNPWDVAVGPSGNVYVADTQNHRIQVFDSSGTYLSQWGEFGTGDGQFNSAARVAVAATGTVYVADHANNRVQKFDDSGTFLGKWGTFGTGDGQFNGGVGGMGVDASGNVYVADQGNNRVQKFDGSGTFLTKWGTFGSDNGQFKTPWSAAVDSSGNVYVTDWMNSRIQKFGPAFNELVFLDKWGANGSTQSQFSSPNGVAIDSSGNIYVADGTNNRIQKFNSGGAFVSMWGWGVDDGYSGLQVCTAADVPCQAGASGSGNGQLNFPYGVAVDSSDNVYVADFSNHRIQKFSSSGAYLAQWGSYGTGNDQFNSPFGVGIDGSDNVYVADSGNHRILKFNSSGVYQAQWGSSGTAENQFNSPADVAVDASGNIYVADNWNHRVQKFNSSGTFVSMWGWGVDNGSSALQVCTTGCEAGSSGSGDGQFTQVFGVAVGPSGNIYVGEYGNHRIQKFDNSGALLSKWGSFCNTGSAGVDGCDGRFNSPTRAAVDGSGNVYVNGYGNNRLQKFGPCSFAAVPGSDTSVFGGGADQFDVDAIVEACGWQATSNDAWIQVTAPPSYIGDETVDYSVDANPTGIGRAGTITVADQSTGGAGTTFAVNQDPAPCTFGLSPTSASFAGSGGGDNVTVTTLVGCAWTAVSNDGWITVTGSTPGSGSGTVLYSVAANAGSAARSGSMTIGGTSFTVTQDPQIPDAPSNLAAVATGSTKVKLTWDDNAANEAEIRLERKLGAGGTYAQILTLPPDTTGTTDSPVQRSTTYYYRVMACNSVGCSTPSSEVSVTTPSLGFFIGEELQR